MPVDVYATVCPNNCMRCTYYLTDPNRSGPDRMIRPCDFVQVGLSQVSPALYLVVFAVRQRRLRNLWADTA